MNEKSIKSAKTYTEEFKKQALELARELGTKKAAEKLGILWPQTLAKWVKHARKMEEDGEFRSSEELKAENKKLKKELAEERKITAILKDAAAFFCMENRR